MLKFFKTLSTIIMLAITVGATTAAFAASTFPTSDEGFNQSFWTMPRMKVMDKNKDGMVSRQEYMDYMMAQFDMMDQNKDKMLSTKEFMDKKMMADTFPRGSLTE